MEYGDSEVKPGTVRRLAKWLESNYYRSVRIDRLRLRSRSRWAIVGMDRSSGSVVVAVVGLTLEAAMRRFLKAAEAAGE